MTEITLDPTKSIPAFYAGQSILLTGATGFVGKVFIEKVLRCCPDVREIFLLMRPKKKQSLNERLEKMLNLPLYEKLREERPSSFKKLIPISSEMSSEKLGISTDDMQMLLERVTIVIHGAASVKFNDSLKYAILANTRSTRDICILAQSIRNLVALIYISTAYTQINNPVIEEKTYAPIADWRKMIKMAESLDEHTLNIFTAKCMDNIPNTYIFSKNLAESIIQEYSSSLPNVILRPSSVSPALNDPFPGWMDNYYGPIGVIAGYGKGVLRAYYANNEAAMEIVPVDFFIKSVILAIWKIGVTTNTSNSTTLVVNCVDSKRPNRKIERVLEIGSVIVKDVPFEGIIWLPGMIITKNFFIYYILTLLLHILPALLIDQILKLSGRQPMLVKLYRKVFVVVSVLSYFTSYDWIFHNTKFRTLTHSIIPDEQGTFSYNLDIIDDKKWYTNGVIGIKKFLFNEDMNQLDKLRARNKRRCVINSILKIIFTLSILWMIKNWIF